MASFKEKIREYFTKYPDLRVLFFFDPEAEFLEEIDDIEFDDIKVIRYDDNDFQLKTNFNTQWSKERVFLIFPNKIPETQDELHMFPLLDLLIANKVLLLDDISILIEELGWRTQHKQLVAKYCKELKYGYIQDFLKHSLHPSEVNENSLSKALLFAWLGAKEVRNDYWIPGKLLTISIDPENEEFLKFSSKAVKYNLIEYIKDLFERTTGLKPTDITPFQLQNFVNLLKYNCVTFEITISEKSDPYKDLKIKDYSRLQKLNSFRLAVESDKELCTGFKKAIELSGHAVHESEIVKVYGVERNYSFKTEELIKVILSVCSRDLESNPDRINSLLLVLQNEVEDSTLLGKYGSLLIHASGLVAQIEKITSFILDTPSDYINSYIESWHKIDQDYRKSILYLRDLQLYDKISEFDLDKLKKTINKYYNDFLKKLNREWLKCLSSAERNALISQLKWQYNFYDNELKNREVKTVVIISDGFRFEAATELIGVLHQDPKNIAELRYMSSSLPSVTSVGMSNLLPAKSRVWDLKGIFLDNENVDLLENRGYVLKQFDSDSKAYNYSEIKDLSHDDKRKLFTNGLVYVYQNIIDAIGDKRATEGEVFGEVEKAIKELASFIKQLHTSYNVTRVIVTADHGFLYTDETLDEVDKETIDSKEILDKSSRYAILKSKIKHNQGYLFAMNLFSKFENEYYIIIPEAVNRYKHPGSGLRYVHGGASLQEMIVPVLDSRMKRKEVFSRVSPVIVEKELKLVSNICKFTLSQDKPVSEKDKERTIIVGLYDESEPVTELQSVVMNKVSGRPSERIYNIQLNLSPVSSFKTMLKLKIFDREDLLNPIIDMDVVNKTMITPDFQ